MRGVLFQVAGQVDDGDGLKRAFFHANAAANAQLLGYRRYFVVWRHLYTQFAHSHDRARFLAFLAASLRLAFVVVHDGDTDLFVCLLNGLVARHPGR